MTVIENDYVKGNLPATIHKVIDRIKPINTYLLEEAAKTEAAN